MGQPVPDRSCQCNRKIDKQPESNADFFWTYCTCVSCPNEMTAEDLLCDDCRWAKKEQKVHCHGKTQMGDLSVQRLSEANRT